MSKSYIPMIVCWFAWILVPMCYELGCWLFGCLLGNAIYPVMNMMKVLFVLYDVLCAISKNWCQSRSK